MLVLMILVLLKGFLFLNGTSVEHDNLIIWFLTGGISLLIISLISLSNMKEKTKNILLSIFYTSLSLVMMVDVVHYAYFGSLPSVKMLSQAGQLSDVTDSIKGLINFRTILLLVDIPFVIYYLFKREKGMELRDMEPEMRYGIPFGILLSIVLIFGYVAETDKVSSVKLQELYSFHAIDIMDTALGRDDDMEQLSQDMSSTKEGMDAIIERSKFIQGDYTGIAEGRNLIVLQIEALQSFVVGLDYLGQEITPNVNALIEDQATIYYDDYYQLLGRGNTADAEFVSNNSLHPSMESPSYDQFAGNTFFGLPWVLRDEGYNVWAFHGYKKEFWSRDKAYPNQGYERFLSEEDFEFTEEDVIDLGVCDAVFYDQTLDYMEELEEMGDPYYAFIVSLTSHNPFNMPDEYHVLEIEDKYQDTILGNYLQSIHYADQEIGRFIEGLKERGMYEDTIIALYGDHFAIQDTEKTQELMGDFLGRPYYYDELMHIPMIVHVPGEDIHHRNSRVGSQIDFMPTILNMMGYENEKTIMFGVDLNHYEGENLVKPQTQMRKGSFISDEVILEMSRTEIFDHSRVLDKETKQELAKEEYRDTYDQVIKEINLSNFLLKNNLIKDYVASGGSLDLDEVEITDFRTIDRIDKKDAKSLRELERALRKSEMLEIYIDREDSESELMVNDAFRYAELVDSMREHSLFIRSEGRNINAIYSSLKTLYPESRQEYIIEIDNFEPIYYITQYGFENIVLNLSARDYDNDEILDFINMHSLYGLIIDEERIDPDLFKELRQRSMRLYVETEDSIDLLK